jgi:hypothetical protein
MALLGNERMMMQILTCDDFNYEAFNKNLFNLNVKLDHSDHGTDQEDSDKEDKEEPSSAFGKLVSELYKKVEPKINSPVLEDDSSSFEGSKPEQRKEM